MTYIPIEYFLESSNNITTWRQLYKCTIDYEHSTNNNATQVSAQEVVAVAKCCILPLMSALPTALCSPALLSHYPSLFLAIMTLTFSLHLLVNNLEICHSWKELLVGIWTILYFSMIARQCAFPLIECSNFVGCYGIKYCNISVISVACAFAFNLL